MDIVKDILDNIINYSLFFYDDKTVEQEQLDKYIMYVKKKINNNYCDLYYEKKFSILHIDEIITIDDYINKLVIGLDLSNSIIIGSIIYLERLNINLNIFNIHKLLLISLLLSSKFIEDSNYKNKYWSRYGGLSLKSFNYLEAIYLIKIEYKLYITTNEFIDKFNDIFF